MVKFCVPKQKVYRYMIYLYTFCLGTQTVYVALVSLRTVFLTDVLQKHGPPGPLLSKNWGSGPPQPPPPHPPSPRWMRLCNTHENLFATATHGKSPSGECHCNIWPRSQHKQLLCCIKCIVILRLTVLFYPWFVSSSLPSSFDSQLK